ncbi:mediator of RNA polymerase II transcription subunit 15-like [Drosophila kikkawai]|uniref:Mediator of RNA polymerase II transcription subunit 15-like n=1 Tax=Drosophila kikkawai TaxID=30033 RepID=A0A6P4J361_DROKI|nr:histone-lysine N-methyltransferase 2D-like [Drosophila kikkawai]XP_017035335.1 histone-lysine N-methyltransferase 2D-like [Drosophila kikkawai]
MPSKKHLGSHQGSRINRRRTVQLSEFLREDEEGGVLQQAKSQNSNEGSIGWVSVSSVKTPDTQTNESEKTSPSPPTPRIPLNAWGLSSAEKDPYQETFKPDQQAFPDLGMQVKKVKTLALPEANRATGVSLETASPRRGGPVLGNFMPKPLLLSPGKDQAVASWLSSVRSDQRSKPASCSPPKITVLKRPTYQQPKMSWQPVEPAQTRGPFQQKNPPKSPGSIFEYKLQQKRPAGPSSQENPSAREETKSLVEIQAVKEEDALVSAFQDQGQGRSRGFWGESHNSSLGHQSVTKPERETAGGLLQRQDQVLPLIQRSLLNANAKEFRPMVRQPEWEQEQEQEQEQLYPAEEYPPEPYESRLTRRRRLQRAKRSKRWSLEQANYGQVLDIQVPLAQGQQLQQRQRLYAGMQQQQEQQHQQKQQQQQSQASTSFSRCYYSVPPAHHHHQHPRERQRQHQAAQLHQTNHGYPVYATQTAYRAPHAAPVYGAPSSTSSARLDYVAAPATGRAYEAPIAATRRAYRASSYAAPVYVASPIYAAPPSAASTSNLDYIAGAATPRAYGAPPAATSVYAASPTPPSSSNLDYITGAATPRAYGSPPAATPRGYGAPPAVNPVYAAPPPPASSSNLDYVAAPAATQTPYGGYLSMVCPFIWAME